MSKNNINKESNEMRNSSYMLIAFGIIGLIFLALELFGVTAILPQPMHSAVWMVTMIILCVVFVVSGILSIKSAKKLRTKENDTAKLYDEIVNWFIDGGATPDKIDSMLPNLTDSEEQNFLMRTEVIQEVINHQFKVTDVRFLNDISEDLYEKIYEGK